MKPTLKKPLLISLGHRFRGDDAAGPLCLDALRQQLADRADYHENGGDITHLLDVWRKRRCLLVDAMDSTSVAPGQLLHLDALRETLPAAIALSSSHALNLAEALALGRALDSLPASLDLYAIAGENFAPAAQPSSAVSAAIRQLVQRLLKELDITAKASCGS